VVGICEHSNEPSGSIKGEEFHEGLCSMELVSFRGWPSMGRRYINNDIPPFRPWCSKFSMQNEWGNRTRIQNLGGVNILGSSHLEAREAI
jgi:hypothetical protein